MMTDGEIIGLLESELYEAMGYDSDTLSANRRKALDYYHGRMQAAPVGRSQIVSYDVADTVHALMAQSADIFKNSIIEFEPQSEQDEEAATLESNVVQSLIETNDAYQTFNKSSFNAFLQGNGWVKVWIDEDITKTTQQYPSDLQPEEILAFSDKINKDPTLSLEITTSKDTINAHITRTVLTLKVEAVSSDVMLYSPSQDQYDLQKLRFVAERRLYTTADLIEMGLTEDEALSVPDISDDYWEAVQAREGEYSETTDDEDGGNQSASKLKETFICYILIDLDENNTLERYKIHKAGSFIIEKEPIDHVPYITGSPLPMPHRIQGTGMYDLMHQVQDSKTSILRAYQDNLTVMNQSRVGYVRGEVNMDELLSGRINGAVGMDNANSLFPIPSNDIGQTAIQGLQYLDQVRTQRGGASVSLNKEEMQVARSSAAAAVGQDMSKEMMAGYYCKNLANTLLKQSYLLVHHIMRTQYTQPINAKINGKWIQSEPASWQARSNARLRAGMTSTEKRNYTSGLNQLLQQQQAWIQQGQEGIITNKAKVYRTASDWLKAADITATPEEYLINPESEEAQQAAQQAGQQQQQQQQKMQQQQQQMIEMQVELERMKDATERWKTEIETEFDYYKVQSDADLKEAHLTVDNVTKINIENAKSERHSKIVDDPEAGHYDA